MKHNVDILLASRFFNGKNGGMGVYAQNVLKRLLKRYNVSPMSSGYEGMGGYFRFSFFELFKRLKLPSLFGKIDYDVYHALSPMESVWMPKDQAVVTVHDLFPLYDVETHYSDNWFKSRVSKRCFDFAMKQAIKAKRIITVSDFTKRDLVKRYDVEEDKIRVIRHGVNPNLEPVRVKESGNFTVGTLSYLDARKRINILIDAFKELDNQNAELLIPSTGERESYLKKYAQCDDRIRFLGYLPEWKKAEFLSSLDVMVFPTRLEGYGLPIIESLACETPVVTLKDAIIPSDVQRHTKVVSKEELAMILENREFGNELTNGYEFAKKHDWDVCIEKINQVYSEVI